MDRPLDLEAAAIEVIELGLRAADDQRRRFLSAGDARQQRAAHRYGHDADVLGLRTVVRRPARPQVDRRDAGVGRWRDEHVQAGGNRGRGGRKSRVECIAKPAPPIVAARDDRQDKQQADQSAQREGVEPGHLGGRKRYPKAARRRKLARQVCRPQSPAAGIRQTRRLVIRQRRQRTVGNAAVPFQPALCHHRFRPAQAAHQPGDGSKQTYGKPDKDDRMAPAAQRPEEIEQRHGDEQCDDRRSRPKHPPQPLPYLGAPGQGQPQARYGWAIVLRRRQHGYMTGQIGAPSLLGLS